MSTRSACALAALGLANPCPVLPARPDPWTRARPHATSCALGEATRDHNAVTALVHATAQSGHCTAELEVPGLIPGTDLRPADVLASALGNSYTALDISICSPHAQQAGPDCTQTRLETKLACYGPHLSLLRQNIANRRPLRDTLTVLRSLSKSIARKRNFVSAEVVYQKLASPWKCGNSALCKFGFVVDPETSPCLGPPGLLPPAIFWSFCVGVPFPGLSFL